MRMKGIQDSLIKNVKLPLIKSKVAETTRQDPSKKRPISSKTIEIDNMEKKLFAKIDSIQKAGNPHTDKIRSKKIISDSGQEIKSQTREVNDDGLQKISKLMPQLYSKLQQIKKNQPLKETKKYGINSSSDHFIQQPDPFLTDCKIQVSSKSSTQKQSGQNKVETTYQIQEKKGNSQNLGSEDICDKQIQRIYQEYLQQQGLPNQTSSRELQQMNIQLMRGEKQVMSLQKSFSSLLTKLQTQIPDIP